jgi:hypothetical protein
MVKRACCKDIYRWRPRGDWNDRAMEAFMDKRITSQGAFDDELDNPLLTTPVDFIGEIPSSDNEDIEYLREDETDDENLADEI